VTGFAADHVGLGRALLVPVLCYAWIAFFGFSTARGQPPLPSTDAQHT
jgi:fucose permease